MPIIEVSVPSGIFNQAAQDKLVEEVCNTVLKWEKIEASARSKAVTWAYFDERATPTLYIGGQVTTQAMFRVTITTPLGMLDRARKGGLIAELTRVVLRHARLEVNRANAAQVWCIIHEVSADNWGGGGRLWGYEQIRDLVGAEVTPPILEG